MFTHSVHGVECAREVWAARRALFLLDTVTPAIADRSEGLLFFKKKNFFHFPFFFIFSIFNFLFFPFFLSFFHVFLFFHCSSFLLFFHFFSFFVFFHVFPSRGPLQTEGTGDGAGK